ncbi:cyclin-dependent protein kinase, variant 2 [Entomophthora muscae]|uniref:Cyclin-dependent protein kinase, variant 2 n=2 Tax=Entomophthora muscae TaxID=34485 RepID=A0ACC2REM7_9FUNG|nr:cyclin-dependent protein kinase, variant 2 [Entomophthora muscae]
MHTLVKQAQEPIPFIIDKSLATQFKKEFDEKKVKVFEKYEVLGFISSGTYGRVYKAISKNKNDRRFFAIKKFKSDKDEEASRNSGISQSACREIGLCSELNHVNIISLEEVALQNRSIYMVFKYVDYDFQQIIHHHTYTEKKPVPESTIKSLMWQLINGVCYLHENWVMHRDLKPANVLVTSDGIVKVGDLGLARSFFRPIQPLYNSDKVVVTVWYRAPELILGSKHYTKAIDMWSVGCIFGEFLTGKPMFKGEELRNEKKGFPFQKDQMSKIIEVLGNPTKEDWPDLEFMPDYREMCLLKSHFNNLRSVFTACHVKDEAAFDLLKKLLIYDPKKRITAVEALSHVYFRQDPKPTSNAFAGQPYKYLPRKLTQLDSKTMKSDHIPRRNTGSSRAKPLAKRAKK